MTRKYISTEMLIIFTALMIIANFYYIFFEKIGFLLVLLLGCVLVYVGYVYFHKVRGLLSFWIGTLLIAFTLLSNKYTIIILFIFLIVVIIRYLVYKFRPLKKSHHPFLLSKNGLVNNIHQCMYINGKTYRFNTV